MVVLKYLVDLNFGTGVKGTGYILGHKEHTL
jgi:hypothetical protein